jgi:hypothetical protein
MNGSHRLDKIESIRLEQIDYIEVNHHPHLFFIETLDSFFQTGPNQQFLRIITVKHTKLRCLTTGCVELTR